MPRLIVIRGADENKSFELNDAEYGIGRDSNSRICLHDTEVSRRHAEVVVTAGQARIRDVGSANGTYVNNQRVTEAPLSSGDHIQIGQTTLVFSSDRTEPQPPADLADHISMITRHDVELSSAIVKTIGESEGSRILARPDEADTAWLRSALATNLGIMYETINAVSHILDIDQLLERIMELVFRSIEADRGCIMLKNADTGTFVPKSVRRREGLDAKEKIDLSRTIMEYVLKEKQGVLVSDAGQDPRFKTGLSILHLGIREVICVPMKGRNETLGVLYLDTRTSSREVVLNMQSGKFTGDHLALAIAIGHLTALAIEETRYHQAMLQAERLAAIGQTVAALSHHIKNILQGLDFGAEMIDQGLNDKNETFLVQGWKIVRKNHGKVYDLVRDMLTYSKEREPALEDANLNEICRDVVELLAQRAKEVHARLEARLDPRLPVVPADPEGVHRALLNILGNALDAVEEVDAPLVHVATAVDGKDAVQIVVTDNGVGIPPEKLNDIFKPFVSTKGSRGTGLGLAVSRKILREHGGDITVQSEVGKGSRFTLRIPRSSPLMGESLMVSTRASPPLPPAPN